MTAALGAVDLVDSLHRVDQLQQRRAEEAGATVDDDLRHRAARAGDHWRAARHRFDHHQAERLRPVDRKQQGTRAPEKRRLVLLADLAEELHERIIEHGRHHALEVLAVARVDLGGDLQRHAHAPRDLDGQVHLLFRRAAAEEGKIATVLGREGVALHGLAVVHRPRPPEAEVVERPPLRVADRHERDVAELAIERPQPRQVEPPVQRVHGGRRHQTGERKGEVVHVAVNHVEVGGPPERHVELADGVRAQQVVRRRLQPHGALGDRHQPGRGARIAAGEQRDVVTAARELVGEIGHDALGASIAPRRHGLEEGSHLRDTHRMQ